VIVGDGAAGMTAARTLRGLDPAATITVLSDDPNPAYFRAALTNYLLGELREEQIWATPPSFYEQHRLERLHARAIALDAARAQIHSSHSAVPLSYDGLLLCCGARARAPSFAGGHLLGVMTLRTLQDCRAVMELVTSGRIGHSTVIGGGPLALEWALGMHARGVHVTVLLRGTAFMQGALDAVGSDLVAARLRQAGVEVVVSDEVAEATDRGDGSVARIRTKQGRDIPCDLLACAIGVVPNSEWLAASGIALGKRGQVVIDDQGRTSLPGVFAAGDVVEVLGRTLQLWEPAQTQARVAARNLAGIPDQYAPGVHYMATRLFDLDFASLGEVNASSGAEEYSQLPEGTGTISYQKAVLRGPHLVGALMLGQREAKVRQRGRLYKRLIDSRADVSLVKHRLLDPDFDLAAWADQNTLRRAVPGSSAETENRAVAAGAQIRGTSLLDLNALGDRSGMRTTSAPGSAKAGTRALSDWVAEAVPSSGRVDVASATQALGTQVLNAWNPRPKAKAPGGETPQVPVRAAFLIGRAGPIALAGRVVRLGRDPQSDVPLQDEAVDSIHAHLELSLGHWYLRDLGSRSGTWVNGDSVDVPKRLNGGERITLGQTELVFCYEGDDLQAHAASIPSPAGGPPVPRFTIRSGRSLGLTFVLDRSPTVIGSDAACTVWLQDPGVAPQHAHVQSTADAWQLVARVPGTLLNGVPLAPGHAALLQEKHRVRVGPVELAFSCTPLEGHAKSQGPARNVTAERARMQAFAAVTNQTGVRLRVEAGAGAGTSVWLADAVIAGSGPNCQLQLPQTAPVHVEIQRHEGRFWVRAFAPCTKGGVALSGEFAPIELGERLLLGSCNLVLEEAAQ
jgi:NADPH-dependent 2,4-dienoyl-CoA reductase/sulfur reductase-like enzyme/pSer/pThr/pTyr-binding forkhead associated (FHA) protein